MITIHDYDTPSAKTWQLSVKGIRYSWGSNDKSDSYISLIDFELGAQDKALMLKLIKAGTDHSKFMRQLPVVVDLTAPEYWFKEMDTYRVGITRNSSSMMHTLGKEPFNENMFSWEDLDYAVKTTLLHNLNYHRDRWIDEGGKRKGPEAYAWRAMLQTIPQSWNYHSVLSMNYQVLRSIYHARKNHRLSEWRTFCSWIEELPHAILITGE